MANEDRLPPIHPGEILREEFLSPLGMSAHELSMALRVPATRINDIVNEKRGITADTALRLSRYFGTTSRFWMNMQASWDPGLIEAVGRLIAPDISAHATISGMETQGCGQVRARAKTAKMGPSIRRIPLETGVGTMTIQRILAASCRDTDRSL